MFRFWSALAYAISAFLFYSYCKTKNNIFSKKEAIIAVLVFLFSPFALYYASEARPYALIILVSLLQFILFEKVCETDDKKIMLYYGGVSIVGVYLFYPLIFSLVGHFLYIVFVKRSCFKKFILPWAAIFIVYVPWMYLTVIHRISTVPGHFLAIPWWQIPAIIFVGFSGGRVAITDLNHVHRYWPTILISIVYAVQFIGVLFWWKKDENREYLIRLLYMVGAPLAICLFISIFRFSIFDPRYYTEIFFIFILFITLSNKYFFGRYPGLWKYLVGSLIAVNLLFFTLYVGNPWFMREPWNQVVTALEKELQPEDVEVYIGFLQPPPTYTIYQKKNVKIISTYTDALLSLDDYAAIEKHLSEEIGSAKRIWFSSFLEWQKDPEHKIRAIIEKKFRYIKTIGFFKVKYDLYERK
jgi:hypothetical protein